MTTLLSIRDLTVRYRGDGVAALKGVTLDVQAGKRLAITEKIERVFELDHHVQPRAPIYLLTGAHCTGAVLGTKGPCDRACAMLWHEDWLILEDA